MNKLDQLNAEFTQLLEEIADRIANMLFHKEVTQDYYSYVYEKERMEFAKLKLSIVANQLRELEATQ